MMHRIKVAAAAARSSAELAQSEGKRLATAAKKVLLQRGGAWQAPDWAGRLPESDAAWGSSAPGCSLAAPLASTSGSASASSVSPLLELFQEQSSVRAADRARARQRERLRLRLAEHAMHARAARCMRAPPSVTTPLVTLGGHSQLSYQVLVSVDPFAFARTTLKAAYEASLVRLRDDNEYLEDTHSYMAAFIEKQKDRIADLEHEVARLRSVALA